LNQQHFFSPARSPLLANFPGKKQTNHNIELWNVPDPKIISRYSNTTATTPTTTQQHFPAAGKEGE
jgi:hypothetical protein